MSGVHGDQANPGPASAFRIPARLTGDRRNRAALPLLATYALIALSIGALAWTQNGWVALFAFVLIGLMQYRLVLACHEAVHKAFLFPLSLNELSGVVNGALVGINFHRYRHQHLAHHRARNLGEDPDAYIYGSILRAEPGWARVRAHVLGVPAEILEKFRQKGFGGDRDSKALVHSLVMVIANGLLFGLFAWAIAWWAYPVFWLGPVLTVAVLANRSRVFAEHAYHYSGRAWTDAELAALPIRTIDLVSNPIERFFAAGFCFHYHAAHHRAPTVPHYNLLALCEMLEEAEENASCRIDRSYASLLVQMWWGRTEATSLPR